MKKIILLALLGLPASAFSQSDILGRIKQKAKTRADQHVDQAIDKSMDKAEEEVADAARQQTKEKTPADTQGNNESTSLPASFKSYSRYDFIPGERIVYSEDFSSDAIGELPLKWITNNRGETVTVERIPGKWMRLFPDSRLASPATQKLPGNFTMEADLLFNFSGDEGYVYPELEVKLLEILPGNERSRSYVVNQDAANEVALILWPGGAGKPLNASMKSFANGSSYFSNQMKELKNTSVNNGNIIHVSLWVQKERIRYWINGDKVFDIPQAVPGTAGFNRIGFSLESSLYNESQLGIYVSNIKIAEGTPDMRNKLITEGRMTTNGILFDVASDKIKPESAGVLKEIATVLKENPSIRVKIVGHTDSDGDDTKNLDLSRRRATAVQRALNTEFGVELPSMQTDGSGETKPIADNNSKEGKAKNRRVEFVKL